MKTPTMNNRLLGSYATLKIVIEQRRALNPKLAAGNKKNCGLVSNYY
jgi:hypothetical protein